jgi:hypothetical protein
MEIDEILRYRREMQNSFRAIRKMSANTDIPCRAFRDWHKARTRRWNDDWFPLAEGSPNHYALIPASERAIADSLEASHMNTGIAATRTREVTPLQRLRRADQRGLPSQSIRGIYSFSPGS